VLLSGAGSVKRNGHAIAWQVIGLDKYLRDF
jgi:hypothetical protein